MKQLNKFTYLGTTVTYDGKCTTDIKVITVDRGVWFTFYKKTEGVSRNTNSRK